MKVLLICISLLTLAQGDNSECSNPKDIYPACGELNLIDDYCSDPRRVHLAKVCKKTCCDKNGGVVEVNEPKVLLRTSMEDTSQEGRDCSAEIDLLNLEDTMFSCSDLNLLDTYCEDAPSLVAVCSKTCCELTGRRLRGRPKESSECSNKEDILPGNACGELNFIDNYCSDPRTQLAQVCEKTCCKQNGGVVEREIEYFRMEHREGSECSKLEDRFAEEVGGDCLLFNFIDDYCDDPDGDVAQMCKKTCCDRNEDSNEAPAEFNVVTQTPGVGSVAIHGFAVVGLGFILYGAGKHFLSNSDRGHKIFTQV